jgi:hypothetical protein
MSTPLINLSPEQMADAKMGDVTGRDHYEGVPFEQVVAVLTRWLDKEPHERRLAQSATERRLDQIFSILLWVVGVLLVQAIVVSVALFITLTALLNLVGPHLIAGA